jgi:hypothetical protein
LTTDELLLCVAELGLTVHVSPDGKTSLRGDRTAAIPELLRVLALPCHKPEVMRRAGWRPQAPARTWYWPRGHTYREVPGDATFGQPDWHPTGAWWFRFDGDPRLRAVPGRPGAWAITCPRFEDEVRGPLDNAEVPP